MISFKNVCKRFEGNDSPLFSDFNLDVEDGEFVLLTGKSGVGKSTLIRMLIKEIEPDSGEITVDRYILSKIGPAGIPDYRRKIGVVFQDFKLFEEYTVYGNLSLVLSLTGGELRNAEKKITDILTMLGIDNLHRRYPRELSGGEKQKVCMARALINNPMVLLADEPTGNLDPKSSAEIMTLMELIHRHGTTVVMATHDLGTAERLKVTCRMVELDKDFDPATASAPDSNG